MNFVATKEARKVYFQVAATVADEAVRDRELRPLLQIKDHYEKVILSTDEDIIGDYEGIKNLNLIDFLLADAY